MKREEFLKQLEQLLDGISEEEKADALAFYRSYFEDAGEENEESGEGCPEHQKESWHGKREWILWHAGGSKSGVE